MEREITRKDFLKRMGLVGITLGSLNFGYATLDEKETKREGLTSMTQRIKGQKIHSIVIDPKSYNLNIVYDPNGLDFETMVKRGYLGFINGSFFDENLNPWGLLINNFKKLSPQKNHSSSGIFYMDENNSPEIKYNNSFNPDQNLKFAIQGYPTLVHKTKPQKIENDEEKAARTAIGITGDSEIVLLSTKYSFLNGFSLKEIADLMAKPKQEGGFGCTEAVNLDGGSSAQIYLEDALKGRNIYGKISHYVTIEKNQD